MCCPYLILKLVGLSETFKFYKLAKIEKLERGQILLHSTADRWILYNTEIPMHVIVQDYKNNLKCFAGIDSGNLYRSSKLS